MNKACPSSQSDDADHDLMVRLAQGDELALNRLMDRWSDRVASFLYRMTGRHDTALDLAQETFVKLYQARNRYRPRGSQFSTWLFAIASNLAKNHARWRFRHPEVPLESPACEGVNRIPEPQDAGADPAQAAIARESAEQVRLAVLALPDDQREALMLFTHEQLGYAEIARIARCSPKAVETRIYRARLTLKQKLKGLGMP
jgi:RNA polymerase sigma-70 factor (ECF subfamily)